MKLRIFGLARLALAGICTITAFAGLILSAQAYELLVESLRFNAAFTVGLASMSLLLASFLLALDRRGGLVCALASGIALLVIIAFGLSQMGRIPLLQAVQQAHCGPAYALCFDQVVIVARLCEVLVLGCIALLAFRYPSQRFAPTSN